MVVEINVSKAKNRLSQLIRLARAGEEVVIFVRGKPAARLIAAKPASDLPVRGSAAAILSWLNQNPLPAHSRRAPAEIDASILEDRNGWGR